MSDTLDKLKEILIDLDLDEIEPLTKKALDEGIEAREVLKALTDGMLKVGELYEQKEYYLPELVLAGECMETGLNILRPHLKADAKSHGTVVAATVKGDLHDIGKNIVVTLLTAAGFNVVDLGKDVSPEKVVEAVKEHNADIIALSALLTMTVVEIENVVKLLKEAGLRDKVKIMVGGAPLNQELAEKLGADFSCDDAVEGIRCAKKIMQAA